MKNRFFAKVCRRGFSKWTGESARRFPEATKTPGATFEGANYLGVGTEFSGSLGYASYLGNHCAVSASVGRFTCIAAGVKTVNGFHPTSGFVSVHPAFFSRNCTGLSLSESRKFQEFRYADPDRQLAVQIGNDVWIGRDAILIAGITIGDGAVVGAGAVVTKNVPPYTIVAGNPARELRKRFSEKEIEFLREDKWWEKDPQWLREHAELFESIAEYRHAVEG